MNYFESIVSAQPSTAISWVAARNVNAKKIAVNLNISIQNWK